MEKIEEIRKEILKLKDEALDDYMCDIISLKNFMRSLLLKQKKQNISTKF